MTAVPPPCPVCKMENTYQDGEQYICADCAYEWPVAAKAEAEAGEAAEAIVDANGNVLQEGDAVILIKDLKVKGSSITLKQGTKIKNIRLASGDHAVDCRTEAGNFMLKQSFLKKAT
ncbi:MAG: zinc ribbon domain-containing protein YjdM [Nevskia sp.]|nr:zinc ribbon domain-containing protein YjdM [Nevskia sp.]